MNTHHAQLIKAREPLSVRVADYLDGEVVDFTREKFGIDDVRACIVAASRTPQAAPVQSLLIRTNFITLESQHALLKLLEEPPATTKIVIVVPGDVTILPTVLSRVVVVDLMADTCTDHSAAFIAFGCASYADRLKQIDQAAKKKDTAWYRTMKDGLIEHLRKQSTPDGALEYTARLLLTRGAANKMLLEQVALSLPLQS